MNITDSEDKLFAEWKSKRKGLVSDGVVDETAYLESAPRLLFVLKEVNDPDRGDWDLREFLRCGGRRQTWNNVARWVEGIRRLSEEVPWQEFEVIDEERRREALSSIAAVNLKKSPGGHTADASEVASATEEDQSFLRRQFTLYDPDVIVCCGTSDLFESLWDENKTRRWLRTSRGVWFYPCRPGKYVIAYSHPAARCPSHILYYGLVDAVREILAGPDLAPLSG